MSGKEIQVRGETAGFIPFSSARSHEPNGKSVSPNVIVRIKIGLSQDTMICMTNYHLFTI